MTELTLSQAAEILGVTSSTIRKRIAQGTMKARPVSPRLYLIDEREVEKWRDVGKFKPGRKAKPPQPKRPRGRPRKQQPGAT